MSATGAATGWLEGLLAGRTAKARGPADWVNALRGEALEASHRLTVPTTRDEDWRFTDLSPLYRLAFRPAHGRDHPDAAVIGPFLAPEARTRLVFVDGAYSSRLSMLEAGDRALAVLPLARALAEDGDAVRERLARLAPVDADAFAVINAAWLQDGAYVRVSRHAAAAAPVHLLFLSTEGEVATHPRCLVVAEPGSELTLVEDHVGLTDAAYCVNAVTEIAVGEGARVRHVKLQREGAGAFQIARTAVALGRDAEYRAVGVTLGARLSRHTHAVRFDGEGGRCELDGLALIGARQLADTHSFVDHAVARCTSRQLHKCVVGGGAHAVFNGRVLVREGAQATDSAQQSRNVLLSDRAHVDTKPQLEIFADDVKCSHGATVGQLEAEELFYLRSRGLAETAARNLLTYGFAAEIVGRVPLPSIAAALKHALLNQTHIEP